MHVARSMPPRRALLLALLLAAFALRIYQLTFSGFWFDEAASHFIAQKGLIGIFDYVRPAPGEHPPIYYWLLYLWMLPAGTSEFALRYFSLWFGVLFVALFYRFMRHHFAPPLPLLATTLAAALPYLVGYSQEARMYTLALCLSLVAMDAFLRWTRGERHAALRHWFWLLLAVGTQYFAILLLAAQDVYVLARRALWPRIGRALLIFHLAVAAALLVWLLGASGATAFLARVFANPLFAGRTWDGVARTAVELTIGAVAFRDIALVEHWLAAGIWLMVLLGVWWAQRQLDAYTRGPSRRAWLYALLIVPPLLAAVIPYIYTVRYLFVMIPALLILMACGLLALQARGRLFLLSGVLLVVLAFAYGLQLNYHFIKSPYREMVDVINAHARRADAIVQVGVGQWTLTEYYLHGPWPRAYIPQSAEAAELVDIDPALRALTQTHARVWVLSEQGFTVDPANNVARWLSLNSYPALQDWFKDNDSVALYLSTGALTTQTTTRYDFGEWLALEETALSTHSMRAGDGLAVRLRWHARKKIPQSVQLLVTLRLVDAQGRTVRERVSKPCNGFCPIDDWFVGDTVEDHHGLLLPRDTPAGEYTLKLEVFAPRQQSTLHIQGPQGELGTSLELARIQVSREP